MLRETALRYLQGRDARSGQTVQIGWNVLRITEGPEGLDVESLDFERMASFTADLRIAEQIQRAQEETLRMGGLEPEACNLMQTALVSRSYTPRSPLAFIERCGVSENNSSGWYVGVVDDPLRIDDPDSFILRSLYELTIQDERLARWWLIPVGYRVFLSGDRLELAKVVRSA